MAYCHNCGQTGYATLRKDSYEYDRSTYLLGQNKGTKHISDIKKDAIVSVHDGVGKLENMSAVAESVLLKYNITQGDIDRYEIRYLPDKSRLMYTYLDGNGRIASQQFRAVNPGQSPKYYTIDNPDARYRTGVMLPHNPIPSNRSIVIVEDYISAITVNKKGHIALPLRGVHYDSEQLFELCEDYPGNRIVVWLDDDSLSVAVKAKDIARTLRMLNDGSSREIFNMENNNGNEAKHFLKHEHNDLDDAVQKWGVRY